MESIYIRNCLESDSLRIWEIRNAAPVRQQSQNTETISFESHQKWFLDKYFNDTSNRCFVSLYGRKVVGYCRCDLDAEKTTYTVSIAVDPSFHGMGIGRLLLKESVRQMGAVTILADVKKNNLSSIRLFRSCGFILQDQDDDLCHFLKRPAP